MAELNYNIDFKFKKTFFFYLLFFLARINKWDFAKKYMSNCVLVKLYINGKENGRLKLKDLKI